MAAAFAGGACVLALASCTSEAAEPALDAPAYRAALTEVCANAAETQSALVEPTDTAGIAPFATEVARLLDAEAEAARSLRPPDELDADHRAFVQNTADQARGWRELAATDTDDAAAFAELRTEILQLTLGRDDLATEMGVDGCRRGAS